MYDFWWKVHATTKRERNNWKFYFYISMNSDFHHNLNCDFHHRLSCSCFYESEENFSPVFNMISILINYDFNHVLNEDFWWILATTKKEHVFLFFLLWIRVEFLSQDWNLLLLVFNFWWKIPTLTKNEKRLLCFYESSYELWFPSSFKLGFVLKNSGDNKKGQAFLFLLLWIREEGGRDLEAASWI